MGTGLKGFRVLAVALLVAAPASVFAHAKLVTPKPRVDSDAIKTGPCGAPRTNTATTYQPGQKVAITWREGIDHNGCFDVMFSEANDQNWIRLERFGDDAGPGNTNYTAEITLPNTPCQSCTLAVRQIMMDSPGTGGQPATATGMCSPTTPDELDGGYTTYFSCADIQLVAGADGGTVVALPDGGTAPGPSGSSGGNGTSGGPTTTPVDGGGNFVNEGPDGPADLKAGKGEDCSVGWGAAPGASAFAAAFAVLALARRRRRAR